MELNLVVIREYLSQLPPLPKPSYLSSNSKAISASQLGLKINVVVNIIYLTILVFSVLLHSCSHSNGTTQPEIGTLDSDEPIKNDENDHSPFSDYSEQINQVVRSVLQDSKGNFWFGTQGGAFKLVRDSLKHIDGIKSQSGKGVTIKDIAEDKDGKLWLAHTDGISSIDEEKVTNYYESDGLISYDAWCIEADSKGNIWVGTIDGVSVFDGKEFIDFELPEGKLDTTRGVSSTKIVHSILEDSKGTMWFSTNAGLFSFTNNPLKNVSESLGISTPFINEIMEDSKGTYWISTKESLYHLKGDTLENVTAEKLNLGKGIGSIAEDKKGNIWFVFNQHDLYTYDGKKLTEYQKQAGNKGPVIYDMYKDQKDRLWLFGFGGAFRLEEGKFVNVTKDGPW